MNTDIILIIAVFGSILFSMTLHEAMHGFVAHYLGDDTAKMLGRLTLNPLAHIDPFLTLIMPVLFFITTGIPFGAAKPVPFNPYRLKYDEFGAALVGLAGPLTNLGLAIFVGLWTRFVIGFNAGIVTDIFIIFVFVNLGFFVFNMIPFPPLDGSRVLYALAPDAIRDFMKQIENMGLVGVAIFMIFVYGFISSFVGQAVSGLAEFILGRAISF